MDLLRQRPGWCNGVVARPTARPRELRRRRRPRADAGHAHRGEAGPHDRSRARSRRDALVRPDSRARELRVGLAPLVLDDGLRPCVLVHPRLDRRARRCRGPGGGPRVGSHQHVAADWRCDRRRGCVDVDHLAREDAPAERSLPGGGVHLRVPLGVLDARRRRDRGSRRNADADPPGRPRRSSRGRSAYGWLRSARALRPNVSSAESSILGSIAHPGTGSVPPAFGSDRATRPSTRCVVAGAAPFTRAARFACAVRISSGSPRLIAATILRAARRPEMVDNGVADSGVNSEYNVRRWPLNSAATYEPVRIRPGTTVVTDTPLPASSVRSPSENPTAANFAAL